MRYFLLVMTLTQWDFWILGELSGQTKVFSRLKMVESSAKLGFSMFFGTSLTWLKKNNKITLNMLLIYWRNKQNAWKELYKISNSHVHHAKFFRESTSLMVILQSVPVQIVIKVSNLNPLVKFLWRWTTNMVRKSDKNLIMLKRDFITKYQFNYINYLRI